MSPKIQCWLHIVGCLTARRRASSSAHVHTRSSMSAQATGRRAGRGGADSRRVADLHRWVERVGVSMGERLVAGLSRGAGRLVAVPLGGLARWRGGKPMHPRGAVFEAVLERHGGVPERGVPWLDAIGSAPAVVRL